MSVDLGKAPAETQPSDTRVPFWRRRPALLKAGLSIFDQAIYSGTSFVTAVIVGRSLSTSDLGVYYLTLTIVMVLFGIQDNVVAGPFAIYGARRRGRELAAYTGSMWAHHAGLTILAMLGIIGLLGLAIASGAIDFVSGLTVLIVAAPLMLLREGIRRLTFARLALPGAIVLDAAVSALQLGGLAALAYLGRLTVPNVFVVMGAACAIASLGWFVLTRERPRPEMTRVGEDWRHNWAFAKWAVLSWLTVDTVPFVMPWIVDLSAGKSATGLYGACGTLIGVTNILVVGTGNFLRPKAAQSFATGGVTALRFVLLTTGALFAVLFGLFTLCMVFAGDFLGGFVYGEAFRGTWPILAALAATVLTNSLGFTAVNGLWAVGRPRASLPADIVQMVITLVAAAILVGPYGALGAALTALTGSIAGTLTKITTLHLLLVRIAADAVEVSPVPSIVASDSNHPTSNHSQLRVSVIIPTYNRSDLMAQAIDSALNQTRVPDEIVVVDDGSADDTQAVLARYGSPVVAIWQPNRGVSAARNLAMERATGDILLFLDSDDLLLPRCVQRCAEVFETKPEVDVIYTDLEIIDGNGKRLGVYSESEPGARPSGDLLGELAYRCITNMTSGAVRRTALKDVRFDPTLPCAQDCEFWCQLAARCQFEYIDDVLAAYRYHGDQVTTLRVGKMLEEAIEVQRRVMSMPEFARVSSRDRARIYSTHGVKHALCQRLSVARHFFWKAVQADPTYLPSEALLAISLGGGKLLRWSIEMRRRLAGNHIEALAIRHASVSSTAQRALAVTVPAGAPSPELFAGSSQE